MVPKLTHHSLYILTLSFWGSQFVLSFRLDGAHREGGRSVSCNPAYIRKHLSFSDNKVKNFSNCNILGNHFSLQKHLDSPLFFALL